MNIDRKTFYEHTSPMCGHVNVGSGKDLTIKELAETIKEIINYNGKIIFDGQPSSLFSDQKVLEQARLKPPPVYEFSARLFEEPVLSTAPLVQMIKEKINGKS